MIVTISVSETPDDFEDMEAKDFGYIDIEIGEGVDVWDIKAKIADALREAKGVDVLGCHA